MLLEPTRHESAAGGAVTGACVSGGWEEKLVCLALCFCLGGKSRDTATGEFSNITFGQLLDLAGAANSQSP
uniref:Uncharacterized protein n=1 Tax=Knipowitschia caucasica TaxID=637954 RepID=A0AAV2KF01_KNICA